MNQKSSKELLDIYRSEIIKISPKKIRLSSILGTIVFPIFIFLDFFNVTESLRIYSILLKMVGSLIYVTHH